MKIAVIGAGNVGGTLGRAWTKAGHTVRFGLPDPTSEKYSALREEMGNKALGTVGEVAADAEVVVLATPWPAVQEAIGQAGNLSGKIVVDCTNPLQPALAGLTHGHTTSGAELVAEWAPGARVYKAFNQTGYENMANPVFPSGRAVIFVAGDDHGGKEAVLELAQAVGFEAVDAGPLQNARLLEPFAMLWIQLAFRLGQGRGFAFGLLRRDKLGGDS